VQLIIVDYLQLLRSTSTRAQDNRQLEISAITAGLKGLAKELKIPIIVVAQLNRQPEQRSGGKPRSSDRPESDSIANRMPIWSPCSSGQNYMRRTKRRVGKKPAKPN
jgi:replicative DNA helicase